MFILKVLCYYSIKILNVCPCSARGNMQLKTPQKSTLIVNHLAIFAL